MKIKINDAEYSCRSVQRDQRSGWAFRGVTPKPVDIEGVVEVINDDGTTFDIIEPTQYARAVITGEAVWLTKLPPFFQGSPEQTLTYKLAVIRDEADKQAQQITDAITRGLSL